MLKVIIFDMDGTLVDTDPVLIHLWGEMFDTFKKGFKYSDELFKSFSGPSLKDTITKYFSEYDYEFIKDEYSKRGIKYYDVYLSLFPNEINIIKKLHNDGYKLVVYTSKNRERTLFCLKKLKLEPYFSYVVTSDDVINTKPHPEGLYKILDYFKVSNKEALMVGDTKYDFEASKNANINSILLDIVHHDINNTKPFKVSKSYIELYNDIKEFDKFNEIN